MGEPCNSVLLKLANLNLFSPPGAGYGDPERYTRSFSDSGIYNLPEAAVERALRMVEHGAAMLDVGGESTRPGATLFLRRRNYGACCQS